MQLPLRLATTHVVPPPPAGAYSPAKRKRTSAALSSLYRRSCGDAEIRPMKVASFERISESMPNEKSISDNVPKQKFVRRLGQAFIERLVQDPWSGSTIAALAAPQAQPAVSPRRLHANDSYRAIPCACPLINNPPISRSFVSGRCHCGLSATLNAPGAGRGARTPDPLITNQVLYLLSYAGRAPAIRRFPPAAKRFCAGAPSES